MLLGWFYLWFTGFLNSFFGVGPCLSLGVIETVFSETGVTDMIAERVLNSQKYNAQAVVIRSRSTQFKF